MELNNTKMALKVGLFVAIGLIAAAASILLLGGDRLTFRNKPEFHARFDEVQGLFPGSLVSLSGMRIGSIKDITMGDDFKLDITMEIEPRFEKRITQGAIVEVKTQGALGDKYIFIRAGKPDATPIPPGAIIPSDETDFMRLLTDRQDGVARIVDLVKELHLLTASINQDGKAARMMNNMTEASEKMKTTLDRLNTVLGDLSGAAPEDQKLKRAMISLANVLEKIDKGQGTLGQLINDPSLHQALKNLAGGTSSRGKFVKDMARETIQSSDKK